MNTEFFMSLPIWAVAMLSIVIALALVAVWVIYIHLREDPAKKVRAAWMWLCTHMAPDGSWNEEGQPKIPYWSMTNGLRLSVMIVIAATTCLWFSNQLDGSHIAGYIALGLHGIVSILSVYFIRKSCNLFGYIQARNADDEYFDDPWHTIFWFRRFVGDTPAVKATFATFGVLLVSAIFLPLLARFWIVTCCIVGLAILAFVVIKIRSRAVSRRLQKEAVAIREKAAARMKAEDEEQLAAKAQRHKESLAQDIKRAEELKAAQLEEYPKLVAELAAERRKVQAIEARLDRTCRQAARSMIAAKTRIRASAAEVRNKHLGEARTVLDSGIDQLGLTQDALDLIEYNLCANIGIAPEKKVTAKVA